MHDSGHPYGHHVVDCPARLDPVKAFRFAPTPFGAYGLDRLSVEPREGTYVMAGRQERRSKRTEPCATFHRTGCVIWSCRRAPSTKQNTRRLRPTRNMTDCRARRRKAALGQLGRNGRGGL